MITSNETAAIFASQNQMFNGMASRNMGMGVPGLGYSPFNYAPGAGSSGFGTGNYGGSAAISTIAGATGIGVGLGGWALGSGASAMVGGGLAGFAAGIAAPLGLAYGAGKFIDAGVRGGQQQMALQNTMSQNFQFMNPNARGGQGFSRDDAQNVGNMVRSLSHMPELMTSVSELTALIPKLKASGAMQGVKSMSEFNTRFKDSVNTIREVAKIVGTTMEDAIGFFQASRGMGFLGKGAQLKGIMGAMGASASSGLTTNQVMGYMQTGANLSTSIGGNRATGARTTSKMIAELGTAQELGILADGTLENMTGLQGPEAVGGAAQIFQQAITAAAGSSPAARAVMLGASKLENGKAVLDKELLDKLRRGEITVNDLKKKASGASNELKTSFTNRTEQLSEQFTEGMGVGGFGLMMKELLGDKGEEAAKLILRRHTGLNANQADVMMDMSGTSDTISKKQELLERIKKREAALGERSPEAMIKKIKTKLHASLFGGIEQAFSEVFTSTSKYVDEVVDGWTGRHKISASEETMGRLRERLTAGGGLGLDQNVMDKMNEKIKEANTLKSSGSFAEGMRGFTGTSTASDVMNKIYRSFGGESSGLNVQGVSNQYGTLAKQGAEDTSPEAKAAREAFQSYVREIGEDKFAEMNPYEKMKALEEAYQKDSAVEYDENGRPLNKVGNRAEAIDVIEKKHGKGFMGSMAYAGTGDRSDMLPKKLDSLKDLVGHNLTVEGIEAFNEKTAMEFDKALGTGSYSAFKNSGVMSLMTKATADPATFDKVFDLLRSKAMDSDPAEVAKQLSILLGTTVHPELLGQLKKFTGDVRDAKSKKGISLEDVNKHYASATNTDAATAMLPFMESAGKLAKDVTDEGLKHALQNLSVNGSSSNFDKVNARTKEIVKEYESIKDPTKKSEFLKKFGKVGESIGRAAGIKKGVSGMDIMRDFGVSLETLRSWGVDGEGISGKLSDAQLKSVKEHLMSNSVARELTAEGSASTEDMNLKTMKDISDNQAKMAAILTELCNRLDIQAPVPLR